LPVDVLWVYERVASTEVGCAGSGHGPPKGVLQSFELVFLDQEAMLFLVLERISPPAPNRTIVLQGVFKKGLVGYG
jgi:hypothetical protein